MDKKQLENSIEKIKTELAMKNYLNGWLIQWYKDKLVEYELKLKKLTEDDNGNILNKKR